MTLRRALVAVSAVQLVVDLAGLAVSLRRRRAFDTPVGRGRRSTVGRDWLWVGTALCPPAWAVAVQTWATARLTAGPDRRARWVLTATAASLVPGHLAERLGRERLTRRGADPVETPLVVAGLALAAATAALGAQSGVRP